MKTLKLKRRQASGDPGAYQAAVLAGYEGRVRAALESSDRMEFARRLWAKDPTLWKTEPQHQEIARQRLGWLTVADQMAEHWPELRAVVQEVRAASFRHAVLLGMGGSSLCPQVLRQTFGSAPGYPDLAVLDTTDPAAILSLERSLDLAKAIFIASTKSGTTTETLSFYAYFYEKVRAVRGDRSGENFVAITDRGTPLEKIAQERGFRRIFLNPPDIGGRYSALSYFGLVPAALMGLDVETLLDRGQGMAQACGPMVPAARSPGLWLGAILAELTRAGKDKVTFVSSQDISAFGYWAEQLLAESTGKEGQGLIPVQGEPLGSTAIYGHDRLFIYLRLDSDATLDAGVRALEEAGHPVVTLRLRDACDLGGEFFRWEVATATAGALLGINPFDEPNVQESKDNTKRALSQYLSSGSLPEEAPAVTQGGVSLYGAAGPNGSLASSLAAFLAQARPGDYLALQAYLPPIPPYETALQAIRLGLRDRLRVAATLGYGPRFLHSTGQLHKGGPDTGLFVQITADDTQDLPIPGESYTFGILKRAQALGDLEALRSKGRRVVRLHLGPDVEAGLKWLTGAIGTMAGHHNCGF